MRGAAREERYCLDADALINIQLYYPHALRDINRHGKNGRIAVAEGVYREICRKTDRLERMMKTWYQKHSAVIRIDQPNLRAEVARMEAAYGEQIVIGKQKRKGFWASKAGRRAADSQVVAVCKILGYIAVSNDQAIQDACHLEDVPCIGWQEFYRRMRQEFSGQGLLFE